MPRRPAALTRLSVGNLPILPFLAPCVFAQWPIYSQRRRGQATFRGEDANRSSPSVLGAEHEVGTSSDWAVRERDADASAMARIIRAMDSQITSNDNRGRSESKEHTGTVETAIPQSRTALQEERKHIAEDDAFQQAYESIWGVRRAAKRSTTLPSSLRATNISRATPLFRPNISAISNPVPFRRSQAKATVSLQHGIDQLYKARVRRREDPPVRDNQSLSGSVSHRQRPYISRVRSNKNGSALPRRPSFHRIGGLPRYSIGREAALKLELQHRWYLESTSSKDASPFFKTQARQQRIVQVGLRARADRHWPMLRTKWRTISRVGNSKSSFPASHWSSEFAKLSMKYDKRLRVRRSRTHNFTGIRKRAIGFANVAKLLAQSPSSSYALTKWLAYSFDERRYLWPSIMLHVLDSQPDAALKVLMATNVPPYPPGYAVSDSMEYIIDYYLHDIKICPSEDAATILGILRRVLFQSPDQHVHMSQKSIILLLRHLNEKQVKELYITLRDCKTPFHENTLLQFVDTFARAGDIHTAVEVLTALRSNGADFAQPKVESVCATLLRKSHDDAESRWTDSRLFAHMLNLGLRPNIVFYNILLQNAVSSGDSETGWRIHDMMLQNDVNTDAYTYSILLNDAKYRMDHQTIDRILSITTTKDLTKHPHIATDLLHARFLVYERAIESRQFGDKAIPPPFMSMLSMYNKSFAIEPLAAIAPYEVELHKDLIQQKPLNPVYPPKETLVVMLIGLLRGFDHHQQAPRFYDHFRRLVLEKHPAVAPLVTSTHVYDAVIMAMGKHSKSLHYCTKVIGDMLALCAADDSDHTNLKHNDSQIAATEESSAPTNSFALSSGHCQPSVRTWSILLKSFIDHGQPRAAEKVLSLMRSRNINPNQITWNSLLVGYARLQDVNNTASVVGRMEDEGWEMDEVAMQGLQMIDNRGALAKALEGLSQRKTRRDDKFSDEVEEMARMEAAVVKVNMSAETLRKTEVTGQGDALYSAADVTRIARIDPDSLVMPNDATTFGA